MVVSLLSVGSLVGDGRWCLVLFTYVPLVVGDDHGEPVVSPLPSPSGRPPGR